MAQVQLDLALGLEAFQAKVAAAEGMLLRLKSKTDAGLSLRTYLDTSNLQSQLKAAQQMLSRGGTSIKIGAELYKKGSQYSISKTKVKKEIIDPIQAEIRDNRDYNLKIGAELQYDPAAIKRQLETGIGTIPIKIDAQLVIDTGAITRQIQQAVRLAQTAATAPAPTSGRRQGGPAATATATAAARQPDAASVRQMISDAIAKSGGDGGFSGPEIKKFATQARKAGIELTETTVTGLRKELPSALAKVADDAILGLAQGLVSNNSSIVDASRETAQTLIKALKKALGIASPSKETRKLGQFSADGFGGGFVSGMVGWERQMAASIRQAMGNAWKQGWQRDAAAKSALADMGRDAGQIISTSLGKALKQGLAGSVAPALKGGLVGGAGGFATGGLVGGLGAASTAIKTAAMPAISSFAAGTMPQKLGMLGQGAASLATGGANDAFNTFLQNSIDSVLQAALGGGGQAAMLGAAGVAGVAGMAGLARGASGSLVSQAVESIKNRILGTAVQQAQGQMEIPGATGGAVGAPIQNASNVMGLIQGAIKATAQSLQRFSQGLSPGELQQQIRSFLWNLAIADEQFEVIRKKTQQLGFRMETAWNQMTGKVPQQLLPPQPVPGTGLVRQQNMQLGNVVGRTAFDFQRQLYGTRGGQIGPADVDQGRGYIDRTRSTLQTTGIGEWRVVDEVNGIWQRIKSDSELAQERLALIAQNMTRAGSQVYRTWTDRQGVGTFNPFDQAFYRPTRPPQAPPKPGDSNFVQTGPDDFASDGRGGGGGGNRFGTPNPGGALALRNVPVEFFTSFRDAERLLAEVERRLASVAKAFDTLKVKSQLQVDQDVRKLAVSLRAVQLAFDKGEVSASDLRAATYGAAREMAGLGGQTAQVQNLSQAFENLGIQSRAAVDALQNQRNLDLGFIESTMGRGSSEATRARNARDIQQLNRANDLVRTAQGASGFGGFRGREIGSNTLNQAAQRSVLANAIREMKEYQETLKLTETNTKTYERVQSALTAEIHNAQRAYAVLNDTASDGERITHLARNAWGTILDDFQNLVPQLLVFAVAYNLILQRLLGTPGAVVQAAASFDRLETSISTFLSATRGIGDASGVIGELKAVALDLGIGFEKAASSYLRFAAATQGTPLQGQEVDIARTLATAGRNQGISGEQIDRASTALTQILSKGRVQSEELRGQLAEQLPGALQISARAFGVTTKELYRMVEAGQIAGDEFVGKFIRQLKTEGASTNQLAGSFSNVTEQLGSSIQGLAAAAGQPALAPLTLALQGVNAVIQALIPVAPVLTGLFVVLGAQALRSALGIKSLSAGLVTAMRAMFASKNPAEGYTAGLARMAGAARLAASALATIGRAALVGLAFEAIAGTIRFLKGEVGALGDEVKKIVKIAEGGDSKGLNRLQKFLGNLNVAQNISDRTTLFDAAKIGDSADSLRKKIVANEGQIQKALQTTAQIDKALYQERLRRDEAEQNRDSEAVSKSVEYIKRLEAARDNVAFAVTPADAQIQIDVGRAAEQATEKVIERGKALGRNTEIEERNLELLRQQNKVFEETAKKLGLLDSSTARVNSLGAAQARIKSMQENLLVPDVDSETFRQRQLELIGAQQALGDQQLTEQERALKTQEAVLRRMSAELRVQENIQRIKLSLVESERKQLEASLDLERTRGRLREAVAQRRVSIAGTLNAPEERLAAEAQLQRVRERNQSRELQMQGQILGKDRERVGIETDLQKQQIKLQTQQLAIDKQMLQIERLKIEAAAKTKGISQDLVRQYYLQMGQIDKTIKATDKLIGQEGGLLQSVEQRGAAELSVLGIRQQELDVQRQLNAELGLTERQVRQIETAQQDIANKLQASLGALDAANASYQQLQGLIEDQLEGVRALTQAELERSRIAEEAATREMGVVDRLLELQQGRNEGGFFERMAKASLLGASGEQEAYNLAQRRMELQRQIQAQQIRQKRLELDLKRQEIKAEEELNTLKLKGLQIENMKAKAEARKELETERLKLVTLGDRATPAQRAQLDAVTKMQLALGGYNPSDAGNSQNVAVNDAISKAGLAIRESGLLSETINRQQSLSQARLAGLERENAANEDALRTQEQLFRLDAAQWFGQFLDKTTQLGRTLGVITDGLSEFRSTVSQAFGEAITNGASASEAIADAGKVLAGKITTGLFDELILKPMEANLFAGLKNLLPDLFKSDQQSLAESTDINTSATQALTTAIDGLNTTLKGVDGVYKSIDESIPRPTTATPTYRAPEDPGLSELTTAGPTAGQVSPEGISNMVAASGGLISEHYHGDRTRRAGYDYDGHGRDDNAHDHFAFKDEATTRFVMAELRKLGYQVTRFGVSSGHSEGSLHYSRRAFDVPWGQFGSGAVGERDFVRSQQLSRDVLKILGRIAPAGGDATPAPLELPSGDPIPPATMTPLPGVGALGPQSSRSTGGIGDQFLSQILGGQFEDVAGLQPLPLDQFASMLAGSRFSDLASAGRLYADRSMTVDPAQSAELSPVLGSQFPRLDPATTSAWMQLGVDATQASQTLSEATGATENLAAGVTGLGDSLWSATGGMNAIAGAAANTPSGFKRLNATISGVVGALGAIGMGVAGAQQIGQGGVSGTLMGLAGIFGSIGSIAGMFGTGGSLSGLFGGGRAAASASASAYTMPMLTGVPMLASGGPVTARKPYVVGEKGWELFFPETNGTVVSNDRSRALLDARGAIGGGSAQSSVSDPFAATRESLNATAGLTRERYTERILENTLNATPRPLDIRYQSEVINETRFVTADQHEKGMAEAAQRGHAMTINAFKNSVKTRRMLGV